jgi:GMP synthase PP-ATPase subunit
MMNIRKYGLQWESVKDAAQFLQEIDGVTLQEIAKKLIKEEHLLMVKKFPQRG